MHTACRYFVREAKSLGKNGGKGIGTAREGRKAVANHLTLSPTVCSKYLWNSGRLYSLMTQWIQLRVPFFVTI